MDIIPAIDLYQRQCVRLSKGEFNAITTYALDPVTCAQHYERQGARTLHIVDLEGAKIGSPQQLDLILTIKQQTTLSIQVGGGLREPVSINALLSSGIDRAVIGSLAVTDCVQMQRLINQWGAHRFVLALDVIIDQVPRVAIKGWQETTAINLFDLLTEYNQFKQLRILCTDIHRDGQLQGPNLALYQQIINEFPQLICQASGGVSALADLTALKAINAPAVIIGKALYENRFSVEDAIRVS